MNESCRTLLKRIAAQVTHQLHVPFHVLWDDYGLRDLLIEFDQANSKPRDIAAGILWSCCCEDGKWNNCQVGFFAAALFMKETLGDIGVQPLVDLKSMLEAGTTPEAIHRWIETHYP